MPARPAFVPVAAALLALTLAGCGSDSETGSASGAVAVTAGDSSCEVATTSFDEAGKVAFDVENVGKDTTEVYVYGKGSDGAFDKVVGEVENIAPGTSRDFTVSLSGGEYEVACKPGQKGDGIRTEITVAGEAGQDSDAAYDREVEVTATDFAFSGLEGFTGKVGEKIELTLENKGSTAHELEVFGPDGKELGEIGANEPGKDGEVVLELAQAGTYRYVCGIADHEERGMTGTFTVS